MAFTVPQFSLGMTFTANTTVTINFTSGPADVHVLSSNGITRFNCRILDSTVDLLSWFRIELDIKDAGGSWTHDEPATELLGRSILTNTSRSDGKTVASLVLSGLSGRITGRDLGWDTDTITLSGSPRSSTSDYMRRRLWIPHLALTAPQVLKAIDEENSQDTVVVTRSPTGVATVDTYGSIVARTIRLDWIAAASLWPHYAADSAFAGVIGATAGDPHCSWDAFRQQWRDLGGSLAQCRYSPDYNDPSTYIELLPDAPWIGNTRANALVLNEAPLLYQLRIEAVVV